MRYKNVNTTEKTYFSIRIDTDIEQRISAYAKEHKWSRNFAINEILSQFLLKK